MTSIGDILQLKPNDKIKIPFHKLKCNDPKLAKIQDPFEMMSKIQSLYSNVIFEKRVIPQNQSWNSEESRQTNDTNELEPKKQNRPHYIVPMHKMSYIETLHRVQLQENLSMLIQQEQFLGNIKLQVNNTILRGGFPTIRQDKKKRAQSLDQKLPSHETISLVDITQLSSQQNYQSNQQKSDFESQILFDQSMQLYNFEDPKKEVEVLPELKSYLKKNGTKFSSSPRKLHQEKQLSPGPAEYQISRFGENQKNSPKQSPKENIQKHSLFEDLKLKSKQLLPDLKSGFFDKQMEQQEKIKAENTKQSKKSEPLIDRFGQPLYPVSIKIIPPGPQDYRNVNIASIENRIKRIQQENIIKSEIKEWVRRNQQQQT